MEAGVLKIPVSNPFGALLPEDRAEAEREIPYFLVGPENSLVEPALRTVLERRRPPYYFPVVFYGPAGTGKSFLAKSFLQAWKSCDHPGPVILESAQEFHRQLTDALESQALPDFLGRYYRAKLWILEDIDHLHGKTLSQIQLAQLLDHLRTQQSCLVVITCQAIPPSIPGLLPRLQSRLMGGLVVNLSRPSLETRRYFLEEWAKAHQIRCTPEALELLASRLTGSLGQLRKALEELSLLSPRGQGIQLQTVQRYLPHPSQDTTQGMRKILHHTARQFAVRVRDLQGPSRKKQMGYARGVVVYLARQILGLSFQQIGLFLGNRDHTTILHCYQKMKKLLAHDPAISHIVESLYETLKSLVTS